MHFRETKQHVHNRGVPPDSFLTELVQWGKTADASIFAPNASPADVYTSVHRTLGPWTGPEHRRAVMLEVMRVLAGFESSWNWHCGVDTNNRTSVTPETEEAGAFQVSMNALAFGADLKLLTHRVIGTVSYKAGAQFQAAQKANHPFAMEFIARLLRHTCRHNGPVLRHEIDHWLRRSAVGEFQTLLT
jgi:hypothetical protein